MKIDVAGRRAPAPWDARLSVQSQGDQATIDVNMRPAAPPVGWDGALEGTSAGLTVRLRLRRTPTGGQGELNYSYRLSDDPARRQLEMLSFMDLTATPGGTVRIAGRRRSERELTFRTGATEDTSRLEALKTFLGWIVEIEDWTGVRLPVTADRFTQENFSAIANIAAAIRRGGFNVTIGSIELVARPDIDLDEIDTRGPMVMRRDLEATLLGEKVPLGRGQVVLEDFEMDRLERDENGGQPLVLRPSTAGAGNVLEAISRPRIMKKPPPSPRKKSRTRHRSRRMRGR